MTQPRPSGPTPASQDTPSTLPRRTHRLNYRDRLSVYKPKAVREDDLLADRWGCQPSTAHNRKLELPRHLADVIEVRRELGALESLAFYLTPIEAAMAHRQTALCAELVADRADAQEDIEQGEYRASPCEATARALLRKRAMERQSSLDHDREIAERWGISL